MYRDISRAAAGYPNIYQGFGRPALRNVLRFADSDFGLFVSLAPSASTAEFTDRTLAAGEEHVVRLLFDVYSSLQVADSG